MSWIRTIAPVLLSLALLWAAWITVRVEAVARDVAVLLDRSERGATAEVRR